MSSEAIGVLNRVADLPSKTVLALAVTAVVPSASSDPSGTVKLQFPELSAWVLPRDAPSAKSSTVLPASAVPVKDGVVSLVMLSVSEARIRSGREGAAGED